MALFESKTLNDILAERRLKREQAMQEASLFRTKAAQEANTPLGKDLLGIANAFGTIMGVNREIEMRQNVAQAQSVGGEEYAAQKFNQLYKETGNPEYKTMADRALQISKEKTLFNVPTEKITQVATPEGGFKEVRTPISEIERLQEQSRRLKDLNSADALKMALFYDQKIIEMQKEEAAKAKKQEALVKTLDPKELQLYNAGYPIEKIIEDRNKVGEGFTLGEGDIRYDAEGNIIAKGLPRKPETQEPLSPEGKQALDEGREYGSPDYISRVTELINMSKTGSQSKTTKTIDTVSKTGQPVTQLIDVDGNVLQEYPKPPKDWTDNDNKMYNDMTTEAMSNRKTVVAAQSTIQSLRESPNFSGGWGSSIVDAAKNNLGLRDSLSEAKTLATRLRNSEIINSLPPGVASDTDVALIKQGFPPDNAGKDEWINYLSALERVSTQAAKYSETKANWFSKNNNLKGFSQGYELGVIEDKISAMKPNAKGITPYEDFISLSLQEQQNNAKDFQETFGFNPLKRNILIDELNSMGVRYGR